MFEKITHAFNPVIQLVQAIAFPLAFISISLACLLMLLGQKHKAMEIIKYATIGYLLMQLVPSLMSILHTVGQEMAK